MKGRKKKGFALVLILIAGGALAFLSGLSSEKEQAIAQPAEPLLPGLMLAGEDRIIGLEYNGTSGRYEKRAEVSLSGITGLVEANGYLFASTGEGLSRLDKRLEAMQSKRTGEIAAIATDQKNIYISAGGAFIALDKDLNELGRMDIEIEGRKKDAHEILMHNGTAYLLDNVVLPVYILTVDAGTMKVEWKMKIEDTWPHLEGQWLEPELGQWLVAQTYSHSLGRGEKVRAYSMEDGAEAFVQKIGSVTWDTDVAKKSGYDIRGVTQLPPVWAVVENETGLYLAQVKRENETVSFSGFFELEGSSGFGEMLIKRKGNYLVLAPGSKQKANLFSTPGPEAVSGNLTVIDISRGEPTVVLTQGLEEVGVGALKEMVVY